MSVSLREGSEVLILPLHHGSMKVKAMEWLEVVPRDNRAICFLNLQ